MNQKLFVKFPATHCYIAGIYESFTLVSLSCFLLFSPSFKTLMHRLSIVAECMSFTLHISLKYVCTQSEVDGRAIQKSTLLLLWHKFFRLGSLNIRMI